MMSVQNVLAPGPAVMAASDSTSPPVVPPLVDGIGTQVGGGEGPASMEQAPAAGASTNQPPASTSREAVRRLHWRLATLAAATALFNVLGSFCLDLLDDVSSEDHWLARLMLPTFLGGGLGFVAGQLHALAIWLVFGHPPFGWRLLLHWAIAAGLITCLMSSQIVAEGVYFLSNTHEVAAICLTIPLLSLAAQLPLWPWRVLGGWHLRPRDGITGGPGLAPLSLKDLFAGMTILAVSLGCGRLAAAFAGFALEWVIYSLVFPCGCLLGSSLAITLPAVFSLHLCDGRDSSSQSRGWLAGLLSLVVGGWVLLGTLALLGVLRALEAGAPVEEVLDMTANVISFLIGFGGMSCSPVVVMQRTGFCLAASQRGRKHSPAKTAGGTPTPPGRPSEGGEPRRFSSRG